MRASNPRPLGDLRPDYTNQLSGQRLHGCNCLVNALPLSVEIAIKFADDYSRVLRLLPVQSDKVQPIQREHSPILMRRKRQDLYVRQGLIGFAGLPHS